MTYAIERWSDFYRDAKPLMERHWQEIALDKQFIPLSLNEQKYVDMEKSGILHVLSARHDGKLAGYFIAFVMPHIHYQDSGLMAFTDIYFMAPEFRKGTAGVRLFVEAEISLQLRGVRKVYLSTKLHHDNGPIFEKLGWKPTDRTYTKLLKEVEVRA